MYVISTPGQLTDHPVDKTVNFESVYNQRMQPLLRLQHECGHAVQHARISMVVNAF
jgi:Zn-dependent membrane protease YugP